jgi:hypothetical protein
LDGKPTVFPASLMDAFASMSQPHLSRGIPVSGAYGAPTLEIGHPDALVPEVLHHMRRQGLRGRSVGLWWQDLGLLETRLAQEGLMRWAREVAQVVRSTDLVLRVGATRLGVALFGVDAVVMARIGRRMQQAWLAHAGELGLQAHAQVHWRSELEPGPAPDLRCMLARLLEQGPA